MSKNKFLKIAASGVILCACFFIISGCAVKEAAKTVKETAKTIENKLGEKVRGELEKDQEETINLWENNKFEKQKEKVEEVIKKGITDEGKKKIDNWLEENDFNQYGDPKSTMYAGGTPLFDEMTGETIDRYEYIVRNHPGIIEMIGFEDDEE